MEKQGSEVTAQVKPEGQPRARKGRVQRAGRPPQKRKLVCKINGLAKPPYLTAGEISHERSGQDTWKGGILIRANTKGDEE